MVDTFTPQLQELEARLAGLRELIARRESQGNTVHVAAARIEQRDKAVEFIGLKVRFGLWDPLTVIDRMESPPPAAQTIVREPTDADVLALLRKQIKNIPDTETVGNLRRMIE